MIQIHFRSPHVSIITWVKNFEQKNRWNQKGIDKSFTQKTYLWHRKKITWRWKLFIRNVNLVTRDNERPRNAEHYLHRENKSFVASGNKKDPYCHRTVRVTHALKVAVCPWWLNFKIWKHILTNGNFKIVE